MSRLRAPGRPPPRLLAGLAVAVLAVGCGAAPRTGTLPPEPTLGPSAVPSSDPTPSSAAPTPDPLVSDDGSDASIRAFMTAYFTAGNRAIETGDVSQLRRFSTPGCKCNNLPDGIASLHEKGSVSGGQATVQTIDVSDKSTGVARALVTASETAQQVLDTSGKVVSTTPPVPRLRIDFILNRASSHWVIISAIPLS